MHDLDSGISRIAEWYERSARPFLEKVAADRVRDLDQDFQQVIRANQSRAVELTACLLGSSGVGKSTLINALVAGHEQIVPSGGIGPLTAQALTIRFADREGFTATYHPAGKINQLAFALQQSIRSQLPDRDRVPDDPPELAAEEIRELREAVSGDDEVPSRADKYRRQAQLMITGSQEGSSDVPYLIDGLRLALGQEPLFASAIRADDDRRIQRLQQLLTRDDAGSPVIVERGATGTGFRAALAEHATGFIAPMIQKLDVAWNAPLLSHGISLVDLPGLGIEGDVYRDVTRYWITDKAKAVVLVVDHRGITEANAQLLRTSGFLNRLLHSAHDPSADPVSLIVAVVKIDDIADSRRMDDRTKAKREHFADVRRESVSLVQNQIRSQLESAWSISGDAPSEIKRQVIESVIAGMRVYPVSAIQYRKCLIRDEDDPAFIQEPDESGVPDMSSGLCLLAEEERQRREQRLVDARDLFSSRVLSTLQLIQTQWQQDTRAAEEAERLRDELGVFLQPLREEFRVRQGGFREFLKETLPQRIETLVVSAKSSSSKVIRAYLKKLRSAHWKTLQAAVRRGGTFHGAMHIELPRDFALTFEEPIAEVWGSSVLKEIRTRTTNFADDCVALVEQVVVWANSQGAKVKPKLVEAQRDAIIADARKLKTVGRELVNELREEVKNNLIKEIEPPIRRKCEAFVRKNQDVGAGVRNRILELFEELADDALEAAVAPAQRILLDCYRQVEHEIRDVFEQHQDPLSSAADAIVESHESRVRRSDSQKRPAVLAEIEAVLAGCPRELTQGTEAT